MLLCEDKKKYLPGKVCVCVCVGGQILQFRRTKTNSWFVCPGLKFSSNKEFFSNCKLIATKVDTIHLKKKKRKRLNLFIIYFKISHNFEVE